MSVAGIDADFETRMRGPSLLIWAIAATCVIFVLWASLAYVDEIVRAEGEVVSSSRPQIIQNLEGGILAELTVAEGDIVEPGPGRGTASDAGGLDPAPPGTEPVN